MHHDIRSFDFRYVNSHPLPNPASENTRFLTQDDFQENTSLAGTAPILQESHAEERLLNHDSVRHQDLNLGLLVIPAQAGIQCGNPSFPPARE
jgi:hypothetical protein